MACASPGCCHVSHFGCAVLNEWSFYAEGRVFCEKCTESPAAEALGGVNQAWAPIHLYKLTSRHLRVMPRTKPKLLEAFVREPERAKKGASHSKKRKAQPGAEPQPGMPGLASNSTAPPVEALPKGGPELALGIPGAHMMAPDVELSQQNSCQAALMAHAVPAAAGAAHASQVHRTEENLATDPAIHGGGRAEMLGESSKRKSDWGEFTDRDSGRIYFHNFATKESVWTRPPELTSQHQPKGGGGGGAASEPSAAEKFVSLASDQSPANLSHSSQQAHTSSSAGQAGAVATGKVNKYYSK